ncbi:MAG: SAM-dependent DNA methyltransferase [Marinobacter sp.]|uniref:type I restriction-modification system subunit M n=1 Tax=Marinobacter sp. TaxID=50741 RepID=UPI001B570562|nr:class I SAM-dependent DNA methyltransferase [Marinobacter sp.]MBQ0746474.1 SAM-dependent DNA methyltransferase [Marinobacter sp.]MBQ0813536.1 SAM-dependent DNA methyltransferase [Marinobacter sp.]
MTDDKTNHSQTAAFIWSVADLLRGDFKQSQYGRVILPFTLLRRLECVLEPTKAQVLSAAQEHQTKPDAVREKLLLRAADQQFFNASPLSLATLSDSQTADDLMSYVQSFSQDAREIFEHFHFEDFVQQLSANNLLYQVVQRFASIDLSPKTISNFGMGIIFEELIRKFAESSNETAGEHFTPRDIVHLTTSLVLTGQESRLTPNSIVTIYDPTAGTGGFLSEGDEYIQQISESVTVSLHGQELNPESYAICKADMLIKGQEVSNIKLGNTLSDDQLASNKFDLMLSNPPFGVEWKKVQKQVTDEHKHRGFDGRFGPGLPRVSDGSLLFLMHLVSKMRDAREGGSRIGIILNGSPLFTGGAGSGESEIRRYLLQNDMVEAIVALPTDMFYNTGISTYVWVLSNNKPVERKGKVQLIDATDRATKMRKSLGSKRQFVSESDQDEIVRMYGDFQETKKSKIFPIEAFGYRRITVERPLKLNFQTSEDRIERILDEKAIQKLDKEDQEKVLAACKSMDAETVYLNRKAFHRALKSALTDHQVYPSAPQLKALLNALSERDPGAEVCTDSKGNPEPDTGLRDYENVPLTESVYDYFDREVKPHVPDAWIDESKRDEKDGEVGIVGFEIPFNRHFYEFTPPRPLEEIDADLKHCTDRIKQMIEGLSA